MIPNKERWHYLAVKKLSVFLRGITSKHHEDLYCLNCLCSFVTKKKNELHKKIFDKNTIHYLWRSSMYNRKD